MLRTLALVLTALLTLNGCTSAPEIPGAQQQYCYTDETITLKNGSTVDSTTTLNCTDKPKVHHLTRDIGIAGMCRPYEKPVFRPNGSTYYIRGVLCRDKLTGKWVPADPNLSY